MPAGAVVFVATVAVSVESPRSCERAAAPASGPTFRLLTRGSAASRIFQDGAISPGAMFAAASFPTPGGCAGPLPWSGSLGPSRAFGVSPCPAASPEAAGRRHRSLRAGALPRSLSYRSLCPRGRRFPACRPRPCGPGCYCPPRLRPDRVPRPALAWLPIVPLRAARFSSSSLTSAGGVQPSAGTPSSTLMSCSRPSAWTRRSELPTIVAAARSIRAVSRAVACSQPGSHRIAWIPATHEPTAAGPCGKLAVSAEWPAQRSRFCHRTIRTKRRRPRHPRRPGECRCPVEHRMGAAV